MKTAKFKSTTNPLTLPFHLVTLFLIASSSMAWAGNVENKVKDAIESVSDSLKKGVDSLGDDFDAIQEYLKNYHWKGLIQDNATSGAVTLSHLHLNDHHRAVIVKPGERIEGTVKCSLDREQCSAIGFYRVVMGIKGQGGQTTVCNCFGARAGKSVEKFTLIAPSESGIYQIRFRLVDHLLESTALQHWTDDMGNEPDGTTTIGLIVVKS